MFRKCIPSPCPEPGDNGCGKSPGAPLVVQVNTDDLLTSTQVWLVKAWMKLVPAPALIGFLLTLLHGLGVLEVTPSSILLFAVGTLGYTTLLFQAGTYIFKPFGRWWSKVHLNQ